MPRSLPPDVRLGRRPIGGGPVAPAPRVPLDPLHRVTLRQIERPTTELVAVPFFISGFGGAITTGFKGCVEMAFDGELVAARLFADQTGSIKVDVWKDTYANYPPTDADTITAGNEPQFTSAQKYEDKLLTGWTRRFFRGDVIGFNVDSAATVTWCLVCLTARPDPR